MKGTMPLFGKPISKVLGDPVKREIKRYQGVVDLINELEAEMSALTDAELLDKTREFRERLGVEGVDITHGQSFAAGLRIEETPCRWPWSGPRRRSATGRAVRLLDDLLPEAFGRWSARHRGAPSACATSIPSSWAASSSTGAPSPR